MGVDLSEKHGGPCFMGAGASWCSGDVETHSARSCDNLVLVHGAWSQSGRGGLFR